VKATRLVDMFPDVLREAKDERIKEIVFDLQTMLIPWLER